MRAGATERASRNTGAVLGGGGGRRAAAGLGVKAFASEFSDSTLEGTQCFLLRGRKRGRRGCGDGRGRSRRPDGCNERPTAGSASRQVYRWPWRGCEAACGQRGRDCAGRAALGVGLGSRLQATPLGGRKPSWPSQGNGRPGGKKVEEAFRWAFLANPRDH